MWVLLNFGMNGYTEVMSESFAASIGRLLVPVLAPVGLGFWQIAVALIAGISAKEVVVSSCAVLFGISGINSAQGMTQLSALLSGMGFGPLNAYCLMLFCLLYVPCAATIATIHKESGKLELDASLHLLPDRRGLDSDLCRIPDRLFSSLTAADAQQTPACAACLAHSIAGLCTQTGKKIAVMTSFLRTHNR